METVSNKTYDQLIKDIDFVRKRIEEQYEYLIRLANIAQEGTLSFDRYWELRNSAEDRLQFFEAKQREILYGDTSREV
jgi:hypothetical protein